MPPPVFLFDFCSLDLTSPLKFEKILPNRDHPENSTLHNSLKALTYNNIPMFPEHTTYSGSLYAAKITV